MFIEAAEEEMIGTYAEGAMERIVTASEEALTAIKASSAMYGTPVPTYQGVFEVIVRDVIIFPTLGR